MEYKEVSKDQRSSYRNFKLRNGDILTVCRIPVEYRVPPKKSTVTWNLTYEMTDSRWRLKGVADLSSGGRSLRAAFGSLRLKLAMEKDPRVKTAHQRLTQNYTITNVEVFKDGILQGDVEVEGNTVTLPGDWAYQLQGKQP